ncbi:MAG: hypothetical protein E5W40_23780, partial [Mesorhizobium sp.]
MATPVQTPSGATLQRAVDKVEDERLSGRPAGPQGGSVDKMEQLSARAKRLLGLDRAGPLRSNLRRLKGKYRVAMARLRRRRTKATVIGITGSSAKTTTAELLAHILEGSGSVHKLT